MRTERARRSFLEAKQDLSHRTLEQYGQALDYLERECPKMPKQPEPIRRALNKAPTIWVKASWWGAWASFFRWCHREYRTPNPMDLVDKPKLPEVEMRALEREELPLVIVAADKLRDRCVVSLALDSGIRAAEFGRLRIGDLGEDRVKVWGKGNKRISVPISPETRHLLQLMVEQDGKGKGRPQSLLFRGDNGQPLSRYAVYRIVRKCMECAGIPGPKLGPHCLRHSLGKNYIANGGDLVSLQRIMRHRNISTTRKYVNLDMDTVVEMHHQHSPLRDAIRGAQGVLIKREVEEILEKT